MYILQACRPCLYIYTISLCRMYIIYVDIYVSIYIYKFIYVAGMSSVSISLFRFFLLNTASVRACV